MPVRIFIFGTDDPGVRSRPCGDRGGSWGMRSVHQFMGRAGAALPPTLLFRVVRVDDSRPPAAGSADSIGGEGCRLDVQTGAVSEPNREARASESCHRAREAIRIRSNTAMQSCEGSALEGAARSSGGALRSFLHENLFGGLSTASDFVDLVQNDFCTRPVAPLQGSFERCSCTSPTVSRLRIHPPNRF